MSGLQNRVGPAQLNGQDFRWRISTDEMYFTAQT